MPDTLIDNLLPLLGYGKVGLAVSGGRDSVALLLLAATARDRLAPFPDIVVYSVDHGLRAESADECRQVADWASACGFAHRTLRWTGPYPSANVMAKAREARYRLIAEAARDDGVDAIATAHHREDQAETVLLRLARGSGVRGLSAMTLTSDLYGMTILRPLLDVPRQRLEAVLEENGHPWIDDPSNDCGRFERIKIRKAGPALDAIGLTPKRLSETARSMHRAHTALDHYADQAFSASVHSFSLGFVSVDWPRLTGEPDEVIFRIMARLINAVAGFDYPPRFAGLERLRDKIERHAQTSGIVATLAGCTFEWEGQMLWIYREAGRRGFPDLRVYGGEKLIWDNRFAVESSYGQETYGTVKALGDVKDFKWGARDNPVGENWLPEGLPKRAVETVPAFLIGNEIVQIAGGFTGFESKHCGRVTIRPIHHDMRMMSQGFR